MSQPPVHVIRHRIEEITLEPTNSKYPISLKVLVDNAEVFRLPHITRGQPLHWTSIPACDVTKESEVSIRAYEIRPLGRKPRVASVQYQVSAVEGQREAKLGSDTPAYTATIVFSDFRPHEDAAATALAQAQEQAANRQRRVVQKLGPTRDAIKTIVNFGGTVAELVPTARTVFDICNSAWQMSRFIKLEAQEQCDESVETLVGGLSSILPLVATVEKAAKLPHLQSTVENLLHLIEDASRFILECEAEGQIGRMSRPLASSTAQARVDVLLQKLRDLKEEFDRGMQVQIFLEGQSVVSSRACGRELTTWNIMPGQRMLLDKLNPVAKARHDPARACLAGTRTDIIENITAWCKSEDDSNRLLWVHGQAGLGKSTIATSVCQKLESLNLLAASFFCKRDDQERRDPQRVLTTVIHALANGHPAYAKALATVIQQDSSICTSPAETQYNKLIVDIFQLPEMSAATDIFVLVIDALDECGDAQTRRRLLGQLHSMSRMANWLKVVIVMS